MRAIADRHTLGFTLIEIIVSIVVFGILITLLIVGFAPNIRRGADPLFSMRAVELGQSYLEEILGKRFAENSPPGNGLRCGEVGGPDACAVIGSDEGSSRINFDDVDDYDYLNANPDSPPLDSSGNTRAGYDNFRVQVSVVYAGADIGVNNTDAKRITVTVTDPSGNISLFSAYKANF